jgi:hypothetical protein
MLLYREVTADVALRLDQEWKSWRSGMEIVECQLGGADIIPVKVAWRDDLTSSEDMQTVITLSVASTLLPALSFLHFASRLGVTTGAAQLYWSPAGTMSDVKALAAGMEHQANGGLLPLLSLCDLDSSDPLSISTIGLSAFGGREIQYSLAALGKAEAIRRVLRLVQSIVVDGPFYENCEFPGLDPSEQIHISLSEDGLRYDIRSAFPSN